MRLRELEVLEKIAATAKLNIVLGDKGLTEPDCEHAVTKSLGVGSTPGPF